MTGNAADTILFADRVVLGGDTEPLRVAPAQVRVSGARIAEVRELSRAELGRLERQPDATVIDLGDRLLSPAFINGHTHLAMAAFRGLGGTAAFQGNVIETLFYQLESGLDADDIRAFARLGAYESLLCGVGLVWDHYYGGFAVAEALRDTGLAGVLAPTLQDVAGPGCKQHESQLEVTVAIDGDSSFRDAGVFAALGPHATDTVSAELWHRVGELSQGYALPVHTHVAQSFEEYARSLERNGCSPLTRLARSGVLDAVPIMLLIHGIFLTEADLKRLEPARHVLGCCPFSEFRYCFPADVSAWTKAGIPWLVGTDCAPCNDSMNVQKELRAVAALRGSATAFSVAYERFRATGTPADARAVQAHRADAFSHMQPLEDPSQLLASVWSVPGTLHPRFRCGSLRPGCLAHLVVWDPHHPAFWPATDPLRALAFNDTTGAIDWMMIGGRFVGERGRFHQSICQDGAYREALREANQRLAGLLSRLGISET